MDPGYNSARVSVGGCPLGDVRNDRDRGTAMPNVVLTQSQIDSIAEACSAAVNEYAHFLDDEVRRTLAQALHAMGKPEESTLIEP